MALDDPRFVATLAEYNQRLAEERKIIASADVVPEALDYDALLVPVGEDVGRLMHAMVVGLKAQIIVELGTSYGYSTMFLADAARATGGRVYSYDVKANKQAYARERLERLGLADCVEFRLGDAGEMLGSQPGPVDFALIDHVKHLYVPSLERLVPILSQGATVIADNMLFPLQAVKDAEIYRAAVRAMPEMEAVLMPMGSGIDIAVKQGGQLKR
ncbi:MAG TPA: class I SAM-dependent methyltransferase [Allosphingosinicella sp.]|nr:class I SAM-dependent methyltransferase [Allosphingosinicella sp.]